MPATTMSKRRFLVADIGGTNSRLVFTEGSRLIHQTMRDYKNETASSVEEILRRYLHEQDSTHCDGCCLAVAGTLMDGEIRMTNLNWNIHPAAIAKQLHCDHSFILNDIQALGYSLRILRQANQGDAGAENVTPIIAIDNALVQPKHASQLIINIGTGFNASVVHTTTDGVEVVTASECGHLSLPVFNMQDFNISQFVRHRPDFSEVEDALSGRGIEALYKWVCATQGTKNSDPKNPNTKKPNEKSANEICAALINGDPLAVATVKSFSRILGIVAGDLAVTHLPFGGIFLSGGVARNLAPHLNTAGFMDAFQYRGRKTDMMKRFPVSVINDNQFTLIGCAAFLTSRIKTVVNGH